MWVQLYGVVMAAGVCLSMSGCGLWVSKNESLRASYALGATSDRDVPVRVLPLYERTIPREGFILPELHEEDVLDDDVTLRHERAVFLASVHNELVSMQHDLLRVATTADQKGAAGWAAFDPKVREFGMSQKLIQRYVMQLPQADDAEWNALKIKIGMQLQQLRAVLLEAQQEIQQVDDDGHFISSNPLSNHPSL
jgi:hypothetical protein